MKLLRLEISGFKSFAKKTVIEFRDGITAIVGPNGSGKSNIADAIRWVLGEQRPKALRGAKMEDVIFNGTEQRKPLAFCEVTLVFDNSDGMLPTDFVEVSVTRRAYRTGEGEYMLNGKQCRLKDVQEIFRDTGIGKEGYSIIGQGKVDEILSNKSSELDERKKLRRVARHGRRQAHHRSHGYIKERYRKYRCNYELAFFLRNFSQLLFFIYRALLFNALRDRRAVARALDGGYNALRYVVFAAYPKPFRRKVHMCGFNAINASDSALDRFRARRARHSGYRKFRNHSLVLPLFILAAI